MYEQRKKERLERANEYRLRVRELRKVMRNRENVCRVERRNRLLNERGSRKLWKEVARIDKEATARRLHDLGVTQASTPTIQAFAKHFEDIAAPPTCEWFDEEFRKDISKVVELSLCGIGIDGEVSCECDWSVESSNFRAQVECRLAEDERTQGCNSTENIRLRKARCVLNSRISIDEYREAKKRMNLGKAVGPDGISFEFIRGDWVDNEGEQRILVSVLDEYMLRLFNLILKCGQYPEAWRLAILVPLLKGNSDASMPTNYRGISLLSSLAKLFANILEHRLTNFQWETKSICDVQFGFTKDRRTLDPVFILDTLIDQSKAERSQLYVAFIDFRKAYDFVPHEGLFYKMLQGGMVGPIYRIIHDMYKSVKSIVRYGIDVSDVISQHVGLRQGCVLSPCLFSMYIADFPKYLEEKQCKGVK